MSQCRCYESAYAMVLFVALLVVGASTVFGSFGLVGFTLFTEYGITVAEHDVTDEVEVRRAAIFVRNRVSGLDNKVGVLEDLVTARISGEARFSIISRENVVNAVRAFAEEGANVGHEVKPEEDLDRILSNRTSALRLAQLMQADYVLIVGITSLSQSTRRVRQERIGIDQRIRDEHLRATYQILDTSIGGTLAAATVSAEKRTRLSDGLEHEPDHLDDLLDDAAQKLADALIKQVERNEIRERAADAELAQLTVTCTIEDLTIPNVVRDEHGEWVVAKDRQSMEVMDVTIELNGVVEGTAPGALRVEPGLSRIRLSRAGFRDWERTINVRDGMELSVALQMTDENRRRMREDMAFFEQLRINQKLSDAHVELLEGYAQMLRQSGYRIDLKHDITIDTDQPPQVEKTIQSFWAN